MINNNQGGQNLRFTLDFRYISSTIADAYTSALKDVQKLEERSIKQLAQLEGELKTKAERERIDREAKLREAMIRKGYDLEKVLQAEKAANSLKDHLAIIEEAAKEELEKAEDTNKASIRRKYELEKEYWTKFYKDREKEEKKAAARRIEEAKKIAAASFKTPAGALFGSTKKARQELIDAGYSESEAKQAAKLAKAEAALNMLGNFVKQLESTMNDVANSQSAIDTRLQGSRVNDTLAGSYWRELEVNIGKNIGYSPLVKQADVVSNLKSLVSQGIAFNVEQRAFLQTIKDDIATTFEATDGTLTKLIRIQQADTTAARLGMESALTAFLNSMYETSEYMTDAARSIRAQLYEASALMGAAEATAFEFQIQKWLGSLYSVGFQGSDALASTLGKLASGDISALTGGGSSHLVTMAATRAGIPLSEALTNGLDDSNINLLMSEIVSYLAGIYEQTAGNKLLAQQYANIFGLSASDLKAAATLSPSTADVYGTSMGYNAMLRQLNTMANSIYLRTSVGEWGQNLLENMKYSTAASIGANPILYFTYNIASMLDQLAGGMPLPTAMVMGTGVDLNTSVADLMRVGVLGGGLLGSLGKLIAGIAGGSGGGFSGSGMLKAFGVGSGLDTLSRGRTVSLITASGKDVSQSGYVGNEAGSDIKNKVMTDASSEGDKQLIEAQDSSTEVKLSTVDEHIVQIHTLLQRVVDGDSSLQVVLKQQMPGLYNLSPSSSRI